MTRHSNGRAGFVRFQRGLARQALFGGSPAAARMALRVLQATDFAGGAAVSEEFLAVLRNSQSTADEILAAVRALLDLGPAGGR